MTFAASLSSAHMQCQFRGFVASFCLLATIALNAQSARAETRLNNPRYLRDHAETRGFGLGRPVKAPDRGRAVRCYDR